MDASPPPWFQLPDAPDLINSTLGSKTNPFVVIGAGLAGCNLAYELAQRHQHVLLVDKGNTVPDGASGNSAGIVKPFVTRAPSTAAHYFTAAFNYFLYRMQQQAFAQAADFNQCGVLQLVQKSYPPNAVYTCTTPAESSALAGVTINSHGIFFDKAGWINPAAFCAALVAHDNIQTRFNCRVDEIAPDDTVWRLSCTQLSASEAHTGDKTGREIEASKHSHTINTSQLILTNGASLLAFRQTQAIPITAARGQVSIFSPVKPLPLKTVISAKHYFIPSQNNLHVGASFSRDNTQEDIDETDHQQNLNGLNALNSGIAVNPTPSGGFVGIRATTPDRLPVVGPVPDADAYRQEYALIKNGLPAERFKPASYHTGLSVLGGLGSRGIVLAPYCARLLSDWLCSTLPVIENRSDSAEQTDMTATLQANSDLLRPARFIIRQLRRA